MRELSAQRGCRGSIEVLRRITVSTAVALTACSAHGSADRSSVVTAPYVVVLGTAQDGGYPQAGMKPGPAWTTERRRLVSSLALVDPSSGERWLIDATPDFREQLHLLDGIAPVEQVPGLAGIFLTHAHVGHYAGLIHLGREIIGADGVPLYVMPRLHEFLSSNGPWDQLVRLRNVELRRVIEHVPVRLNDRISVTAFTVPHRDEYSETVGYRIEGPHRTIVFLPDIDKWERWDERGVRIEDVVAAADVAYLDGTFYADGEITGRNMADIPHPFIIETMRRFERSAAAEKAKIRFIHLNRSNPVAWPDSPQRRAVERAGFGVARSMERVPL